MVQPALKDKGLDKGVSNRRQGSLGATLVSGY